MLKNDMNMRVGPKEFYIYDLSNDAKNDVWRGNRFFEVSVKNSPGGGLLGLTEAAWARIHWGGCV